MGLRYDNIDLCLVFNILIDEQVRQTVGATSHEMNVNSELTEGLCMANSCFRE